MTPAPMNTMTKTLLVLGGTSDIGRAIAQTFAGHGWSVALAGRDREALDREAADIAVRTGARVTVRSFDVLDAATFAGFIDGLPALPDVVVSVVGLLGDQSRAEGDIDHAALVMRSNYEGPVLILGLFAQRFLARGSGTIVGVSSVAGDRGRASNYVYGSAKAGFTAFLSGLRNRCAARGVHVVTVKPGFVRTTMTAGMKLPAPLTAEPRQVGESVFAAVASARDTIYVLGRWRFVMGIIGSIPEFIFKRLKL
jgi:decaprenylphospho-beta-D-erythro-pentofuranosid-2-ulose 2-reductase